MSQKKKEKKKKGKDGPSIILGAPARLPLRVSINESAQNIKLTTFVTHSCVIHQ